MFTDDDLKREITKMENHAAKDVRPDKKAEFLRFWRKTAPYKRDVAVLVLNFRWRAFLYELNMAMPVWLRPETLVRKLAIFMDGLKKEFLSRFGFGRAGVWFVLPPPFPSEYTCKDQNMTDKREAMTYGSVCSGVEAATVAWEPLGWKAAWFSQYDPEHNYKRGPDFPSMVLAHHYPDIPNLGDMLKIDERPEFNDRSIDVLVGGTPCQDFSIAGLRAGLDGERGNLALKFCQILKRKQPRWFVWENVPGVLSSNEGRDFAAILSGFSECGYGFAYRILDAQYFGVPQRRRRVFVIGYFGDWRPPAAVLFDKGRLRGDPAPRRETGKRTSPCITGGAPFSRTGNERVEADALIYEPLPGSHWDDPANPHPSLSQSHNTGGIGASNQEVFSQRGGGLVAARMVAFGEYEVDGTASTVKARDHKDATDLVFQADDGQKMNAIPIHDKATRHSGGGDSRDNDGAANGLGIGKENDPSPTLDTSSRHAVFTHIDGGEVSRTLMAEHDGSVCTDRGPDIIAFSCKDSGHDSQVNVTPTLRAMNARGGKTNGGGQMAIAGFKGGQGTGGIGYQEGLAPTITAEAGHNAHAAQIGMMVRRLTPMECERLQGFPDNYTLIPINNRGGYSTNGHRYKAMGNSMAVPVMRWIGERIQLYEDVNQGKGK